MLISTLKLCEYVKSAQFIFHKVTHTTHITFNLLIVPNLEKAVLLMSFLGGLISIRNAATSIYLT